MRTSRRSYRRPLLFETGPGRAKAAWWRCGYLVVFSLTILTTQAIAHDNPDDVIDAITHRIDTNGPTARLLAARGAEYEFQRQWALAAADFEAALQLQPQFGAAIEGFARALLHLGDPARAAEVARQGLALDEAPDKQAPFHALLAQSHRLGRDWERALEAWRAALRASRPETDWYFGEAECLARLDAYPERARALGVAKNRDPSVEIHRAWLEAMADAGEGEAALPDIEAGLARAHWKCTWLLLRARIYAARGEQAAQQADAQAALDEINLRWNWPQPDRDPFLFAYAGLACGLLGQGAQARAHLEQASALGVPESRTMVFERALSFLSESVATAP